jgi:hypothetical protein
MVIEFSRVQVVVPSSNQPVSPQSRTARTRTSPARQLSLPEYETRCRNRIGPAVACRLRGRRFPEDRESSWSPPFNGGPLRQGGCRSPTEASQLTAESEHAVVLHVSPPRAHARTTPYPVAQQSALRTQGRRARDTTTRFDAGSYSTSMATSSFIGPAAGSARRPFARVQTRRANVPYSQNGGRTTADRGGRFRATGSGYAATNRRR